MRKGYRKVEEMSTGDLGFSLDEVRGRSLTELARMGGKLLLEVALREEVAECLGRDRYERCAEEPTGYRNGRRRRNVQMGAGLVEVDVPKVTGAIPPLRSEVLPAFKRRSAEMEEVLAQLYAEGLSTRDFRRALGGFWGDAGLSRSSVSRANRSLHEAFRAWRSRDLSQEEIVYLFLDGVYLKMRVGDSPAEAVLVAHGISLSGKRVLLGVVLGGREREESWKGLLTDLESRGMKPPALVVHDGNLGLIKALRCVWKDVPRQRCIAHKIRNVLNRVPKKHQARVKKELVRIFYAPCLDEALAAVKQFAEKFGREFPSACGILAKDLADCLTFYRFPQEHWRRLRTSNVIERAFREVRRRTDVVGRFPGEMSAMTLIWATLDQDRLRWHGVEMDPEISGRILQAAKEVMAEKLDLSVLDRYLEAA
jgi:transposase-like protein